MHFSVQIFWNFFWIYLLRMIIVAAVMIRVIVLCSGSRSDGPGHEHVATNPQKVLMLFLLTEWLI